MFGVALTGSPLDPMVHIIQLSLSPVFLLTGIATLLNVFSTRLARVADRVQALNKALPLADAEEAEVLAEQLAGLHRRSVALDVAVVLAAVSGAATCASVLTLYIAASAEATVAAILYWLFGLAVCCALGAIVAYTIEMLMAGSDIRAELAEGKRSAPSALKPERSSD